MRPYGECRQALERALEQGQGTGRALAERAGVGYAAAQKTLDNMVRSGAAVKLPEPARVPGVKRPVPVYCKAPPPAEPVMDSLPPDGWWLDTLPARPALESEREER